ncbi:helix-turn-helix domain-containing protein [Clostridium botulinum]|nr:helix-turn-helix domain-containing protein [Clostridium botulinum]
MNNNNFVINPFMQEGTIYENGYGMIAKNVMRDKRLTPEAKCIYSYIISFAGNKMNAFPGIEKMLYELNMSKSRFYKHRKLLTDLGYISIKQEKSKGKFLKNIYQISLKPFPQNEYTENEYTQNKETNSNSSNSNRLNSNSNLHILSEYVCDCEDSVKEYLKIYLDIRHQYRDKPHKKVSTRNISVIKEELINISGYVDIEEFTDRVHDYFQEINNNNDGDIIYFLKASRRYFVLE